MADSYVVYTPGSPTTGPFSFSFPYLETYHIEVRKNGTLLVVTTDYTFPTSSTVQLVSNCAGGDRIEIRRNSLLKSDLTQGRLVDYTNAAKLGEAELDRDSLQAFYIAQESRDIGADALNLNAAKSKWDAESLKIENVADPAAAQDAATKGYVDTTLLGLTPATPLAVANGGTGAADQAGARTGLGATAVGSALFTAADAAAARTALSLGALALVASVATSNINDRAVTPVKLGAVPFVSGAAKNLQVRTHASTPNSQVTITADELVVKDASGYAMLLSNVNVSPAITVSGENGLDAGSETSDTTYRIWVLAKADGTVCGVLSTSASSPTMPSGYTFKALVGFVRNDGSSNFIAFRQYGDVVYFPSKITLQSAGVATTETAITALANFVPTEALSYQIEVESFITTGAGAGQNSSVIRVVSGSGYTRAHSYEGTAGGSDLDIAVADCPNTGNLYYLNSTGGSIASATTSVFLLSVRYPVG